MVRVKTKRLYSIVFIVNLFWFMFLCFKWIGIINNTVFEGIVIFSHFVFGVIAMFFHIRLNRAKNKKCNKDNSIDN